MGQNIIELPVSDDHALDYWKFFFEDKNINIIKADDFRFVFHADRDLASEQVKLISNGKRELTDEMWFEIKHNINLNKIDQIITEIMEDAIQKALMYL
jgi:hypothetical protein